ncbi:MAG: hypothetical protein ABFD89_21805 [Bryobacteraceae bacterium]
MTLHGGRPDRATIEVFRIPEAWHPFPWRFAIAYKGTRHVFAGIPNQCATRRAASMRAWWRAKWLEDGTFGRRYV